MIEATHWTFYGLLAIAIVALSILQQAFKCLTNPLGSIPGPFHTRFTSLVVYRKTMKGLKYHWVHTLHQKYGPVVRISPNEVSVCDLSTVRKIHSFNSPFLKTEWYHNRTGGDVHNMFTQIDPVEHAADRRLLGNAMSETSLITHGFEDMVKEKIDRWNDRVQVDLDNVGYSDVFKWDTFLATDTIGELTFGSSFETLEIGKKTQYSIDLENSARLRNILGSLPIIRTIGNYFPVGIFKKIKIIEDRLWSYSYQSLQRHRLRLATNPEDTKPTLFVKLYKAHEKDAHSSDKMSDAKILGEARAYIVAGTDTTATSLTYLLWQLSRHPNVQAELSDEMNKLPDGYASKELREAKTLNRAIDESLRLYGAASSALPRQVPLGGFETCGHFIPAGCTVSTQAWTLHRDEKIFNHPESFEPSRWINPTQAMKDAFMPFSIGSRSCIGKNLAMLEMRHAIAAFYRARPQGLEVAYGAGAEPKDEEGKLKAKVRGMEDGDMDAMDFFITRPKGGRCFLKHRVVPPVLAA